MRRRLLTDKQHDFLKKNAKGVPLKDMVKILNENFELDIKVNQLRAYYRNHHTKSGVDTRFKKGRRAPNKGVPMSTKQREKCKKTWYQKGHVPKNHKPIGAEYTVDGYTRIKIGEPNLWAFKHRLIWEAANGAIPDGYVIVFADSDKTNFNLDNLLLVKRSELGQLNVKKLISEYSEVTRSELNLIRLKAAIQSQSKERRSKGKKNANHKLS